MKTTFKYFLMQEAGNFKRQELEPEQFMNILKQHCKGWIEAVKSKHVIPVWRGDNNHQGTLSMGDSNSFIRKAANTENWYALWIDHSRKWKDFPKRRQSYICTNNLSTADGYGEVQIVIPYDTTHIGVVPAEDMWWGFKQQMRDFFGNGHVGSVETFQDHIRACSQLTNHFIKMDDVSDLYSGLNHITLDSMSEAINKVAEAVDAVKPGLFDELFASEEWSDFNRAKRNIPIEAVAAISSSWSDNYPDIVRQFWEVYHSSLMISDAMRKHGMTSLAQVFDAIFTPDNFKHIKGSELNSLTRSTDSEYWIQGPCLFIDSYKGVKITLAKLYKMMMDELEINMPQLTRE